MKYGYKEVRRLSGSDLRVLCIREDWYTGGTNEEYADLLNKTNNIENITTDDIVEIAADIVEHSEEAVKKLEVQGGLSFGEVFTHVMYLVAESCSSYFEEV